MRIILIQGIENNDANEGEDELEPSHGKGKVKFIFVISHEILV